MFTTCSVVLFNRFVVLLFPSISVLRVSSCYYGCFEVLIKSYEMSQSEKVTNYRIGCGRSRFILKLVFGAPDSQRRELQKKLRDVAVGESYEMSHRVRKVSFAYAHCFRDRTVTYQLGICLKVKVTERQVTRCLVTNWKVTE